MKEHATTQITVSALIERLQGLDPEITVLVSDDGGLRGIPWVAYVFEAA